MVVYPLLCTGNLLTQTSTYSGIATITSLLNLVSLTHSPIGPKQSAAILSCSKRKKKHLRKALTKCKYPKWALDKVEKRLNQPQVEFITDKEHKRHVLTVHKLNCKRKEATCVNTVVKIVETTE